MMDRELEKYIEDHSSCEDELLGDLYRQTHLRFVNPNRISGHQQGKMLEFLSRMIKPMTILEIGTFTGYSAICLARGLRPEGKLFTIESNDELKQFSSSYFKRAGLEKCITQLTGRAQDLVPVIEEDFDLVYIDGDKREYSEYFNLIIPKLKPGGFIIADNVLWGAKVLEKESRDQQTRGIIEFNEMIKNYTGIEKIILPLRDGLMIIRKI